MGIRPTPLTVMLTGYDASSCQENRGDDVSLGGGYWDSPFWHSGCRGRLGSRRNHLCAGLCPGIRSCRGARCRLSPWQVVSRSRQTAMVSARLAPSSIAKLPETDDRSGALKNRHCTSPRINLQSKSKKDCGRFDGRLQPRRCKQPHVHTSLFHLCLLKDPRLCRFRRQ